MAGPGDADHGDGAQGGGGREGHSRAERGRIAGDDLAGRASSRPATRMYGVRAALLQPWATTVAAAELAGHRHVADRRADSGHGRQTPRESRAHPGALGEQDLLWPTSCCPETTAAAPA